MQLPAIGPFSFLSGKHTYHPAPRTLQKRSQHTETLAQVRLLVDKHLGRHDIPEGHKHLQQVLIPKLLGQVVDEQVGSLGTFKTPNDGKISVSSTLRPLHQQSLTSLC